jgi:hypothetical protein
MMKNEKKFHPAQGRFFNSGKERHVILMRASARPWK